MAKESNMEKHLGDGETGAMGDGQTAQAISDATLASVIAAVDAATAQFKIVRQDVADLEQALTALNSGVALVQQIFDTALPLIQKAAADHAAKPAGAAHGLAARIGGLVGQATAWADVLRPLLPSLGIGAPV